MIADKQYADVDWAQMLTARCTSYTGGVAWFRVKAYPNGCVVFACTPVAVRNYLECNSSQTVRGEFIADIAEVLS